MKLNFFTKHFIIKMINQKKCFFVPTDTICGLMCKDEKIIYQIKKRDESKKVIKLISNIDLVPNLSPKEKELLELFWPGELTIIKSNESYRMPNDKRLIKIINRTGPLFCSSSNISNQNVINNWKDAKKIFKKNIKYITNKYQGSQKPSTILNLDDLTIIRDGALSDRLKDYIKKNF